MKPDRRVVNNRVFLLGLDELYREALKRHERVELLHCARETASAVSVAPADGGIQAPRRRIGRRTVPGGRLELAEKTLAREG
jgi:hypothetical protein